MMNGRRIYQAPVAFHELRTDVSDCQIQVIFLYKSFTCKSESLFPYIAQAFVQVFCSIKFNESSHRKHQELSMCQREIFSFVEILSCNYLCFLFAISFFFLRWEKSLKDSISILITIYYVCMCERVCMHCVNVCVCMIYSISTIP